MTAEAQTELASRNIEATTRGPELTLGPDQLPWLREDAAIETALVQATNGQEFILGSTIGHNNVMEKIASKMTAEESAKANDAVDRSLAFWLETHHHPNVRTEAGIDAPGASIHKISASGGVRVFFGHMGQKIVGGKDLPVLMLLAKAKHTDQESVYKVLRGKRGK